MAATSEKVTESELIFRLAAEDDYDSACKLINLAYGIETGSTGVAFKTRDRLFNDAQHDAIRQHILKGEMIVELDIHRKLVGCVVFYPDKADASAMRFGPFAVDPKLQGRGLGSSLLARLEQEVLSRGRSALTMEIVNFRTDLPPFYSKHGFEKTGVGPHSIPPEGLSRSGVEFWFYRKDLKPKKTSVLASGAVSSKAEAAAGKAAGDEGKAEGVGS